MEGDECKFAIWTGRTSMMSENKTILKVSERGWGKAQVAPYKEPFISDCIDFCTEI